MFCRSLFSIYGFWLPIWYLQTLLSIFKLLSIVFSVLLLTDSDYPFGIFKQLVITLGVPRVTDSDYPLVSSSICPLCCLSFDLRILITLWYLQTFGHRYESSYYPIWSPENIIVEFEYTKEVIRIRKSKNKQHNGQKFEDKLFFIKESCEKNIVC
jgi:hypothetical protein